MVQTKGSKESGKRSKPHLQYTEPWALFDFHKKIGANNCESIFFGENQVF